MFEIQFVVFGGSYQGADVDVGFLHISADEVAASLTLTSADAETPGWYDSVSTWCLPDTVHTLILGAPLTVEVCIGVKVE